MHPQAIRNLIYLRCYQIHQMPVDIEEMSLKTKIISIYYDPIAREFRIREVSLLQEAVEIDWFENAPARRKAAFQRRQVNRAAIGEQGLRALAARIQVALANQQ